MDLASLVHWLGEILGQVICEQESRALFEAEEHIRALAKARRAGDPNSALELADRVAALTTDDARAIASAFTLYFDLANQAEEAQRVHTLRARERALYPAPIGESIADALATLQAHHVTAAQLASVLGNLNIELVLTAHPTEAKRRTVLTKLKRISDLVRVLYNSDPLPHERDEYNAALATQITELWLTRRARTTRPTVTDEVRTGLYFVGNIFWDALPQLYADLDAALAYYYPGIATPSHWLTIGSWMGGDRDGNPNVTTEVTAETLRLRRGLAVEKHRAAFQDLARRLSLDAHRAPPSPALQTWLAARRPLPAHVAFLETRYANEPYRLALSLLASDLEDASRVDMTGRLLEDSPFTARLQIDNLTAPLAEIARSLPPRLAHDQLQIVRRQLDIFGLHATRLDIREDSARLNAALGEILRALNITFDFENQDNASRVKILSQLFANFPTRPATLAKIPAQPSRQQRPGLCFV